MKTVTFHVLDGVDKGRVFRDLSIPVTIGREEGNLLRLNDERVSRFHAKVQIDGGDVILTDLESTNGTRVNGNPVSIRRLRPGDQVGMGRSTLLFGTHEEIAARNAELNAASRTLTPQARTILGDFAPDFDFDLAAEAIAATAEHWVPVDPALPPMPRKLSPAQAARLSEILDYLHRGLTVAIEHVQFNPEGTQASLVFGDWQKVLAVQGLLARYLKAVAEPEASLE
jgi:pSer/pThr/pTyr-binding forkhead associated (FHA) protein